MPNEPMDVEMVLKKLNAALELQSRSLLQTTVMAGSVRGFEYQALGRLLWEFAEAELADTRRLVEKIVALGGNPTAAAAAFDNVPDTAVAVDALVDNERQAIAALADVIPQTGQEPSSEALEHLLEHAIMRKQDQVDALVRARSRS